jgi:hypothetical protein
MRKTVTQTFTVGASQTDVVQLNDIYTLTGVTITGSSTTGSLITILGSSDGVTFYPVYNSSSAEISLTSGSTAKTYALDPNAFLSYDFVKARLGTSGSPKLQTTANEEILFHLKTIK